MMLQPLMTSSPALSGSDRVLSSCALTGPRTRGETLLSTFRLDVTAFGVTRWVVSLTKTAQDEPPQEWT